LPKLWGDEKRFARGGVGEKEETFSWRGEEVTRVKGLSDAVFAFTVTLLMADLEVPRTFDELLATIQRFFTFVNCIALLLKVWFEQYKFFRSCDLRATVTVCLNVASLFVVLFYVYPLKLLFTLFLDRLLDFSIEVHPSTGVVVEVIKPGQVSLFIAIYGVGSLAVQLALVLLSLGAYVLGARLRLDASELTIRRKGIQGFL
jgi:hypothetical protein